MVCAALIGYLAWGAATNQRPQASEAYLGAVRDRVAEIPYAVGSLVGTDVEVVQAAARMLRPNAIFQRMYRDPIGGQTTSLVFVHCEDVRDLAGHYPPVCYPSAGWTQIQSEVVHINVAGKSAPATRYEFQRKSGNTVEQVVVVSFFALPASDDTFVASMDPVSRAARSPKVAGLGAAHIMIVTPKEMPEPLRDTYTSDIARAITPVLEAVTDAQAALGEEIKP